MVYQIIGFLVLAFLYMPMNLAATQKNIYVVLCMHRTGSSVITKGLSAYGLNLGDHCHSKGADNPQGYFEDEDILKFNQLILKNANMECHSICNFPSVLNDEKQLILQGANLITQKLNQYSQFCFKDPRTARNMPIWHKVFKYLSLQPKFIIIIRNP